MVVQTQKQESYKTNVELLEQESTEWCWPI